MDTILQTISAQILSYLNIPLALGLFGLGFVLKYIFKKLDNNLIPLILIFISIVMGFVTNTSWKAVDVMYCFLGSCFTSCVAVGLHQSQQKIMRSITNIIIKKIGSIINVDIDEVTDDDEVVEEDQELEENQEPEEEPSEEESLDENSDDIQG